jgi:hypothetical protein
MKKVVHVGQMKSGTTYIQNALAQSRSLLEESGWLYPGKLFNQQHACYGLCGSDIPWVAVKEKWEKIAKEMIFELKNTDKNIFISSEALSCLRPDGIDRFVEMIGGIDEVVITIRNLQSVLLSGWQQNIKGGGQRSLPSYIERVERERTSGDGTWRYYSFGETARAWSRHADLKLVIAGDGENKNDLLNNFLSALNLPDIPEPSLDSSRSNKSIKREDAELLRYFNVMNQKIDSSEKEKYVRWLLKKGFFPASDLPNGSKIKMSLPNAQMICEWSLAEVMKIPDNVQVFGDLSSIYRIKMEDIEEDASDIGSHELLERANNLLKVIYCGAAGKRVDDVDNQSKA